MNQVFVCGTYFAIYVCMLKHLYRKDRNSKSLLILNDHTQDIEKIIPALKENGFFDEYLFVPFRKIENEVKSNYTWVDRILFRNKVMVKAVEQGSAINQYTDFIQESELNFFYLWGYPSAYFVIRYRDNFARIIEDGTRNYLLKTSKFKFLKRKYILNTYIGDGFDNAIKEVEVQYPDRLDLRIRHKGTLLELKKMQNNLSAEDNVRILNVFMKDQAIDFTKQKKLLIITQPLSEDGFITEHYKVSLYARMIDEYAAGHEVYVKPHPRELTNYKQLLDRDFIEIPRAFPLEMFDLMKNINFDKGVTLFSSSISNLNCITHKIELGRTHIKEFLPGKKLVQN